VDGSTLTTALNDIYKPALTEWQVTVGGKNITFDYKDGKLDVGDHALLASYSAEMKALMSAYFGGERIDDPDVFYLFVVPAFSEGNVRGYMPRGRNVGFISDASPWVIAHELGHGVAGLEHIQDTQPASNGNLMDYSGGTYLTAEQWEKIQNPGIVFNWFDEVEDAEYETDGHYSTVYLVGLMLGMSQAEAQELAKFTEKPDTYVHSPIDFELNDTWSDPNNQTETHSLTNGFHGTEELLTALKFLFTPKTNKEELGRLLHRYGDTYAHTRLDNATFPIQTDDFSEQERQLIYLEAWKNIAGEKLDQKLDPWIKYELY
jgi:hypothetical protein